MFSIVFPLFETTTYYEDVDKVYERYFLPHTILQAMDFAKEGDRSIAALPFAKDRRRKIKKKMTNLILFQPSNNVGITLFDITR